MKYFKYLLVLICVLILGSCTPSYSSLQSINVINVPDSIEIGKFDDVGIKFELVYSDGKKQIENVTEEVIPEEHRHYLTEEGTHNFSFFYRGIEVEFSITMYELKYTITFVNAIDEVVKEVKFKPDSNLYPTNDEMYVEGYRFLGTYDNDLSNVTSNLTVKGNYVKVWTVEFYNGLGNLISSQLIDDGNSAVSPTADELNVDGYEFVMWDQAFDKVNSDLKIYGIYQKVHTHKYNEVVKEPTCEEQGFTTYTCSCGDTYIDNYTETLQHNYEIIENVNPTCITDGYKKIKCSNCEKSYIEIIKKLNHNLITETVAPTCTEKGLMVVRCTNNNCNYRNETVLYGSHTYEIVEIKDANCTENGYIKYQCNICKDEYLEIATSSHNYVETNRIESQIDIEGSITYICDKCQDSYEIKLPAIMPFEKNKAILLIQDNLPWAEDVNRQLLELMKEKGSIEYYNIISSKALANYDLNNYAVVYIANDQTTTMYNNIEKNKAKLENFANAGGVLVYGVCDQGWGGCGNFTSTLPGGVSTSNYYSVYNYIKDEYHPIVTGIYTDNLHLKNELLKGNYCSHTYFNTNTLIKGTNIILTDANANPTLIEYQYGEGTVIATGLTWEYFYIRNHFNMNTNYSKYAYEDLLTYAIIISDFKSCEHEFTSQIINPSCETEGYTKHTCSKCNYSYINTFTDKLPHTESDWIEVSVPTCTTNGYKYKECLSCKQVIEEITISKLGHDIIKVENVEATCTETGLTAGEHCLRCDYKVTQKIIPATGHTYETEVTLPTCLETGYSTHICHCGDTYVDSYVEALGHNYINSECTNCGDKKETIGLEYEWNELEQSYTVIGIGTAINEEVIVIPILYNGYPVEKIGDYAFYECQNLTSVTIGSSVKSIGNFAFSSCRSLTSITIPESVTSIGIEAFFDCDNLTSIAIPKGVTSIGDYAFYNCDNLTSITIPEGVTSIGNYAFYRCYSLTSINVSENNQYYKSIDGNLYSKDGKSLIQYAIGKQEKTFKIPNSVTSIGDCAFSYCDNLTSITIPESVTSMGEHAFSWCMSLTNITILEGVKSIGDCAFEYCDNLTSITIPESVTSMGEHAFSWCTSLTNITIPEGVTSIGDYVFEYCTSLTSITIPDSVTSIGYRAFYGCDSLTIYCEATSKPETWSDDWNPSNCPVVWGHSNNHTHQFSEWIETIEQTCEDDGYRYKECTICKEKLEEETLPAFGHNYQNNECINCGNKLSNEEIYIFNEDKTEVIFGSYPQSVVYEKSITTQLSEKIGDLPTSNNNYNWISYGYYQGDENYNLTNDENYMWYQDITLSGERYRAVYFTSYRPYITNMPSSSDFTYQHESGYYTSTVYYFKYEPITWKVLELNNNENKAFLFANIALDSQDFNNFDTSKTINGETIYENNYEYSTIRQWLNDSFYNTAFNFNEQSIILDTLVDNGVTSTGCIENPYACNNTLDKVFLLSYKDVINPQYGFRHYYDYDVNKQLYSSDYAAAQGCSLFPHPSLVSVCYWWLRSASDMHSSIASIVTDAGNVDVCANINYTAFGIVPALWISIDNEEEHIHTESDWIIESDPTCDMDGYIYIECVICGEILDEEIIKATGHNYNDKNICGTCGDGCEHVKEIKYLITPTCVEEGYWELVCSLCGYSENEILEKTPHEYIDGICNICNTKEFSSGLEYIELNGVYYLSGLGTCTDEHIIIPSKIGNYNVEGINDSVFKYCDFVKSITINEGIKTIGSDAISDCENLETINIPSSVNDIGIHNFEFCYKLTTINVNPDNESYYFEDGILYYYSKYDFWKHILKYLPTKTDKSFIVEENVVAIAPYAFQDNNYIETIIFECNSAYNICEYAFAFCSSLKEVILSSTSDIGSHAFSYCTNLESIDLGEEIISIDYGAFVGCTSLKEIYIPDSVVYMGYMADYGYNVFYDTPNLIIRCGTSQKPDDWPDNWSEGSKEVIWGC